MAAEAELIERIRRKMTPRGPGSRPSGLLLGIGDDAAVLRPPSRADWVISCDAFLENVHFLAVAHPPEAVGYKALARATSDLAAMGATPRYFLLTLALPADRTGAWLDAMLVGMSRAARRFGLVLVGGDTSQNATVAMSLTVLGEVQPGRAVKRSGARPGDLLYVSGRLGAAQLGLELVRRGMHRRPRRKRLLRAHLYPELRLELGRWLARRRVASAMMDTSDGLSTDLAHICEASGVGARVWAERLPTVRVPQELRRGGLNPLELALHGGEDYELLFTVPRHLARRIPRAYRGTRITCIGEIVRGRRVALITADGSTAPLPRRGWDHFRRQ